MTIDGDLLILDRILAGEQNLYAGLVDRYKSYVYTIAYKILQNRPEAEEAAQDAFIKAFNNIGAFNREAKFSTWLYRIAFNTAISYKRKNRQKLENIETAIVSYAGESGEGALERDDKSKFLNQAMAKLSEHDRTALSLFYLQELSLEEIAEIMSMQANTVKVRVHRARLRIAEELKQILRKEALTL